MKHSAKGFLTLIAVNCILIGTTLIAGLDDKIILYISPVVIIGCFVGLFKGVTK